MGKHYSEDLRKKAIDYILLGHSPAASAFKFDLSPNTVRDWYKRFKTEGHYLPKTSVGRARKVSNNDLCCYVDSNPNKTLVEIGNHFDLTDATIHYHLKRLGYRYKKRTPIQGSLS